MEAGAWAANIKYTVGGSVTADISPRRLQSFNFAAGDSLEYTLSDPSTGSVYTAGYATAERNRFVTAAPDGTMPNSVPAAC